MKIVIACDSFKGSCSSEQVADSVEKGIKSVIPDCRVEKIPVADGGEGTMRTLTNAMGGCFLKMFTHDPIMKKKESCYGFIESEKTAVMEIAETCGLTLVLAEERNPLITTTFGVGEMILDALDRGCRKFIIGIGGSATNDGGMGMMQALGVSFYDEENNLLGYGGEQLIKIARIDTSSLKPEALQSEFTIICDVENPLYGENGAAFVFAPQKGASEHDIEILDAGLRNYAEVIKKERGKDIDLIPGSGAAGGIGAAFLAFLPSILKPGIQCVLDFLNFNNLLKDTDWVITGEGKLDRQTTMGKVPMGVLKYAQTFDIPVIAIGGSVEDTDMLNDAGFLSVLSIQNAPVDLEKAMEIPYTQANIERTISQFMRIINKYMPIG